MTRYAFVTLTLLLAACNQRAMAQEPTLIIPTGHVGVAHRVIFCRDSNLLASTGDTSVKLWDAVTGTELRTFDNEVTTTGGFALSPDCKVLASGSASIIKVWSVEGSDEPVLLKSRSRDLVWSIAFSSDGRFLASGSDDKTITLWDLKTATHRTLAKLDKAVKSLLFADNDRLLVSASDEETALSIWDVASGKPLATLKGHTKGISSLSLSPNGRLLASGSWDGTIRLWNIPSWSAAQTLHSGARSVESVSFSRDGTVLAAASGKAIEVWLVSSGTLEKSIAVFGPSRCRHADSIQCNRVVRDVSFGGRGLLLASVGLEESIIRVWDIGTDKSWSLASHTAWINSVAFSADGTVMASGDLLGRIRLWRLRPNTGLSTLGERSGFQAGNLSAINSLIFSADGRMLAVARNNQVIELWDLTKGSLKFTLGRRSSYGLVEDAKLIFSPDGQLLATVTDNVAIGVWDVSRGRLVRRIKVRSSAIAFSPDGATIASIDQPQRNQLIQSESFPFSPPHTIDLWNLKDGTLLKKFGGDGPSSGTDAFDPDYVTFSPNGDLILAGSSFSGRFRIWDLNTKAELHVSEVVPSWAKFGPRRPIVQSKDLIAYWFKDSITFYDASTFETSAQRILTTLVALDQDDWVVVSPDFRFNTNKIDNPKGLQWVLPEARLKPLPLEIFMRDYYEPQLLPRILSGKEYPKLPNVADLNRTQPTIEKLTVIPHSDNANVVDVTVRVASVAGQCLRGGHQVECESGVYDLRLYRDGQLVKQSPVPVGAVENLGGGANWRQQLQKWRQASLVKNEAGKPVTVSSRQEIPFKNIQLPKRLGVSQVEFTAYAFNEDRVKSATSEAAVYPLPQPRPGVQPKAYIVTVGVDFTSARWRLGFARKGVAEIEALLQKNLKSQYEAVPVQLLSAYQKNSDELVNLATRKNIQTVLNILSGRDVAQADRAKIPHQEQLQSATPDDLVILYIASHGYVDPAGKFYVIPSDIGPPLGVSEESLDRCLKNSEQSTNCENGRRLLQHSISSDELTQWIEAVDAGQMALILDSCHSGAVTGPGFKPGPMGDRSFGQLSYDKGMLVLTATQAQQLETGTIELGNRSVLTYALTQRSSRPILDLRKWLGDAEKEVPNLYRQFVKSGSAVSINDSDQEPVLFDFTKRGTQTSRHLR